MRTVGEDSGSPFALQGTKTLTLWCENVILNIEFNAVFGGKPCRIFIRRENVFIFRTRHGKTNEEVFDGL